MPSVAVNPPKTPVTKGSNSVATATLPNMCKMPPPPPPFCPTPLPNIGMSGKNPRKFTTTVKIERQPVAVQGATFDSVGDIASKATGGGVVSSNAEGPTKFIAPGSLDTKFEGKNVQFLGDQTLNNCGPAGAPANSACLAGTIHPALITALGATTAKEVCDAVCDNYVPNKKHPKAKKAARPSKGAQAQLDAKGIGASELTQWLPSAAKGGGSFAAVMTKAGSWAKSSSGCGRGNTVRWDRLVNDKWVELKGDREKFTPGQEKALRQGKGQPRGSSGKPIVVRPKTCGCKQL